MASLEELCVPFVLECANCGEEFDHHRTLREHAEQLIHRRDQAHLWECSTLNKESASESAIVDLYDTPWGGEPRQTPLCSPRCQSEYCDRALGDFRYVHCPLCARRICEQHPNDGLHIQFREHAYLGYPCLKCYQREVLACGQPREDFEGPYVRGGMYFGQSGFGLLGAGFKVVPGFNDHFVSSDEDARVYNTQALELIDSGHRIVTSLQQPSLSLDKYVSMLAKPHYEA